MKMKMAVRRRYLRFLLPALLLCLLLYRRFLRRLFLRRRLR